MSPYSPFETGLQVFRPPYRACLPLDPEWRPASVEPGSALVWFLKPTQSAGEELAWLAQERPWSLPLFVVLPEPEEIASLAGVLRAVPNLRPKGVLPTASRGTLQALRTLLAAPPRSLPAAVVDSLELAGVLPDEESRHRVMEIFASAPHTASIERLARRLAQSRRTVGRFFQERDLPVPSHWLQFARLLHVSIQLQNTRTSINRVSGRFGYTDGFTLSNAMKRLTGYRPSFVRHHLGWEWIVAAWLRKEERDLTRGSPQ